MWLVEVAYRCRKSGSGEADFQSSFCGLVVFFGVGPGREETRDRLVFTTSRESSAASERGQLCGRVVVERRAHFRTAGRECERKSRDQRNRRVGFDVQFCGIHVIYFLF